MTGSATERLGRIVLEGRPHRRLRIAIATTAFAVAVAAGACNRGPPPVPRSVLDDSELVSAMLAAEDRRVASASALLPLFEGLEADAAEVRRIAVRGLGRMERAELAPRIEPMLADPSPAVRAEAAVALGQAVSRADPAAAAAVLRARLGVGDGPDEAAPGGAIGETGAETGAVMAAETRAETSAETRAEASAETDPEVRGAIAETLGRLPYADPRLLAEAEATLLAVSWNGAGDAPPATLLGVARGLESLARRHASRHRLSDATVARLRQLARYGLEPSASASPPAEPARIRRLAIAALAASGAAEHETVAAALRDPDWQARRLAAAALGSLAPGEARANLLAAALGDPSAPVRLEALRVWSRTLQSTAGCQPLRQAFTDPDPHVRLVAIDLLGDGCGPEPAPLDVLTGLLDEPDGWHVPAQALVSLARLAPRRAAPMLARFAAHPVWQVRMHAARAANRLGGGVAEAVATLERLAEDDHRNVRNEALSGLVERRGHEADRHYLVALESSDYQLLRTAARGLEGSPHPDALAALLGALERVTAERRETSRDARRALLDAAAELGGPGHASALRLYLQDFDPAIAGRAADVLEAWTGEPHEPKPRPLPAEPLPSVQEIERLDGATAIIEMRDGGTIELRLLAWEAPTNAARFARLAESGYFDGLTFHRVVPNFVVQGGSPGANEYAGAGPFTRDELTGRSHLRGTVGISTRGRDTGDAQIFVNLVDNVRLDHDYTIFAEIVAGMQVIDGVLEGATMERVRVELR